MFQDGSQVIIPAFSFNCNGRITGVLAGMHRVYRIGYTRMPEFQVWRPLSPDSNEYSKIGQVQFQTATQLSGGYYASGVLLTGNDRFEFQSKDVIGFYQPNYPLYRISNIFNENYTSYYYNSDDDLITTNLSSGRYSTIRHQPLINVFTGN